MVPYRTIILVFLEIKRGSFLRPLSIFADRTRPYGFSCGRQNILMPTNSIVTHNLALAIFQWAFICLHINHADHMVTYGRPYGGRSTPTPTFIDGSPSSVLHDMPAMCPCWPAIQAARQGSRSSSPTMTVSCELESRRVRTFVAGRSRVPRRRTVRGGGRRGLGELERGCSTGCSRTLPMETSCESLRYSYEALICSDLRATRDANVPPTLSRAGKVKSAHHLSAFYCSSVRCL